MHQTAVQGQAQALQELTQHAHDHSLITEQEKNDKSVREDKYIKELEEQRLILLAVERQLTEAHEKLDNSQAVSPSAEETNRKDVSFAVGEMEHSQSVLDTKHVQNQLNQILQTALDSRAAENSGPALELQQALVSEQQLRVEFTSEQLRRRAAESTV